MRPTQIIIDVSADGEINVTGPLDQKAFCYGVLEMAKDAVRRFQEQSQILRPNGEQFDG